MEPLFLYIHGANSTSKSFSYVKTLFPEHDFLDIEYDNIESLEKTIQKIVSIIVDSKRPVRILGHSLGGVIGVIAAQRCPMVERVATMSAPFGGSRVAAMMRWLFPCQLFNDIQPRSNIILALKSAKKMKTPILSIVTNGGSSLVMHEPNDGVVTVESQTAIDGPSYVYFRENHFEILLHDEAIRLVQDFLFKD